MKRLWVDPLSDNWWDDATDDAGIRPDDADFEVLLGIDLDFGDLRPLLDIGGTTDVRGGV